MSASLTYQQSTSDRVRYNSGFSSSTIGRQECLLAHLKTRAAWLDIIIVANSVDGPNEEKTSRGVIANLVPRVLSLPSDRERPLGTRL